MPETLNILKNINQIKQHPKTNCSVCNELLVFSLSYQGSFNRSKLVVNFFCIFIHIA